MVIARCSGLPVSCGLRCCPLLPICRMVMVLVVLVVAVVLALRGYSPEAITGPVLVLLVGAVAAADRLVDVRRVRPVSALPAS